MGDILLTKDANAILKIMYTEYLFRKSNGSASNTAAKFGDSCSFHKEFLPNSSYDDVHTAVFMLKKNGLIEGFGADNMMVEVQLTQGAIAYCETKWKRNLVELREWLTAIGGLLPF